MLIDSKLKDDFEDICDKAGSNFEKNLNDPSFSYNAEENSHAEDLVKMIDEGNLDELSDYVGRLVPYVIMIIMIIPTIIFWIIYCYLSCCTCCSCCCSCCKPKSKCCHNFHLITGIIFFFLLAIFSIVVLVLSL